MDYLDSIKELERVEDCNTPREQIEHLLLGYHLIRAAVYYLHQDLSTMDEELPLLIYVLLQVKGSHMFSLMAMLEDYVAVDPAYD